MSQQSVVQKPAEYKQICGQSLTENDRKVW
jgi:hypothetical protein